jgi:heterodisulfide reductase subunit C
MEHPNPPKPMIELSQCDSAFRHAVNELSGENVGLCFHCRTCAGGCPFVEAMDYPPHGVLRLAQLGLRKEALECSAIWVCVACNTCSIQCPMAIDIAAIMDALRHMAIEEGAKIAEPDILNFHKEVINSIGRYGRTHKLEIMMRYKLRTRRWFEDMDVGLRMLGKRKLNLIPSRVKKMGEMAALFTGVKEGEEND